MNKVVINFLADSDYSQVPYKAAEKSIERIPRDLIFRCRRLSDIQNALQRFKSDNEPLLLTFMAHGYPEDIRTITDGALLIIPYAKLIPVLNGCKGAYPLIINLSGTCNSHRIALFLGDSPIDELWVTSTTTMSLDKALLAREQGNFGDFYANLEAEDLDLYQQILRP